MTYEDKPRPGRGYLLCIYGILAGSLLVVLLELDLNDPLTITGAVLVIVILIPVCWFVLNSTNHTSYRISDNTLELRCGIRYKNIRLGQILEISHARSRKELVNPFFRRQGFCNRFTNLVRLDIKGDTVFLSPSDPEQFIKILRELKDDSASKKTTSPENSR